MKFLIMLLSFVACVGVIGFGGYETFAHVDDMVHDFDEVMEEIQNSSTQTPAPGPGTTGPGTTGPGTTGPGTTGPETPGSGTTGPETPGPGTTGPVTPGTGNPEPSTPGQGSGPSIPGQGGGMIPVLPGQGGGTTPSNPGQGGGSTPSNPGVGGGSSEPTTPTNPSSIRETFEEMYENHDSAFNDINREMITGMISGIINSNVNSNPAPDLDPDEEEVPGASGPVIDDDYSTDFNPDEFVPEDDDEDIVQPENEVQQIITGIVNNYVDNLFTEIEETKADKEDATEEEHQAAKEEFAQRESEAFDGLMNIVDQSTASGEAPSEEQIVESIDAVLNSQVCKETVSETVESDPKFTEIVQEATKGMSDDTKSEIQNKIESSLEDYRNSDNYDAEKEKQYADLAGLFGITIGNGGISGIPGGFPGLLG